MLRNQRSRNDFMGMDNTYREQPMQPLPPKSQLDATSERLAEQAEDIGWLKAQNDLMNEDNRRLEQENKDLKDQVGTLDWRNIELEREKASDKASSDVSSEIIRAVKDSLKGGK
jgi:regulator of replication initiation timing